MLVVLLQILVVGGLLACVVGLVRLTFKHILGRRWDLLITG